MTAMRIELSHAKLSLGLVRPTLELRRSASGSVGTGCSTGEPRASPGPGNCDPGSQRGGEVHCHEDRSWDWCARTAAGSW